MMAGEMATNPESGKVAKFTDYAVVRANETDMRGAVTPASLCNYLQEIAGYHAEDLGFGIDAMRAKGITWMMSGLHLVIKRQPMWRERLEITTWPSGSRGRLVATRDFLVHDVAGREVLAGVSEWLLVDTTTLKVTRLPGALLSLVPEGAERASVPEAARLSEPEDGSGAEWVERYVVRRCDIDFNQHANNVCYVEWLMEALPDSFAERDLARLDISYRAAAVRGDVVVSTAAAESEKSVIHKIVRAGDNTTLTLARSVWA